ncbi:MAG: glycosyltransferase [Bacteroidia bacterium]
MSKKILFLTPGLGKGGAEKQLFNLAKHLSEQGYMVKIVSLLDRNMYVEELKVTSISYQTLRFRKKNIFPGAVAYIKLILNYRPHLIISFMFGATVLSRLTRLFYKGYEISSIRNEVFGSRLFFKVSNFLSNSTVVNSESVLKKLVTQGVLKKDTSIAIPNLIDVVKSDLSKKGEFRQRLRAQFNISDETFVFLFVGNYRPQKDYENLFQAVSILTGDYIVLLAGNLFGETWPQNRVDELHISDRVKIVGKRDDLPVFYMAADALVMSSQWEGLPNVILEAMSYELPVISTNVGGVEDLIEDRVNGFLCKPKDPQGLAKAMNEMIKLPLEKRKLMGKNSKQRLSEFSPEVILGKWDNLIHGLLG